MVRRVVFQLSNDTTINVETPFTRWLNRKQKETEKKNIPGEQTPKRKFSFDPKLLFIDGDWLFSC